MRLLPQLLQNLLSMTLRLGNFPQNQSFGATVVHEWQESETTVIRETQVDDIEETGVVAYDIPSSVAFANPASASASAA